jgi:hypothetical protein
MKATTIRHRCFRLAAAPLLVFCLWLPATRHGRKPQSIFSRATASHAGAVRWNVPR